MQALKAVRSAWASFSNVYKRGCSG